MRESTSGMAPARVVNPKGGNVIVKRPGNLKATFFVGLGTLLWVQTSIPEEIKTQSSPQLIEPSLKMDVKLNKQSYLLGEPVVVSSLVTNQASEPKETSWFSYGDKFFIQVESPVKGEVQFPSPVETERQQIFTMWRRKLLPTVSVSTALDIVVGDVSELSPFFPHAEEISQVEAKGYVSRYFLEPGSYTLVASHILSEPWRRPLYAATAQVPFQVKEPNEKEKAALSLFRQRPIIFARNKEELTHSQDNALQSYRTLLDKYPETPYAPYARYYIGRILQVQEKWPEAAAAYEATLKAHPDFPLKADLLYYLAFSYARAGDKPKARQVLQTLQKEFPNHLIAPNIRYLEKLSRVEALEQELAK